MTDKHKPLFTYRITMPTHFELVVPTRPVDEVLVEAVLQGMTERNAFTDVKKELDRIFK